MRSDYLGDCAVFRWLPESLNAAQYLVPVLIRQQLRDVVEKPLHSARAQIAPELAQRVLNDVGHGLEQELDQLPALQHALMRTWRKAEGAQAIELEHYRLAGNMSGALNQHAKEIYGQLSEKEQEVAKRVFQRLTERRFAGRTIRRPTSFGELREVTGASSEQLARVIEDFQDFLTSTDQGPLTDGSTIDITHEALIRQWTDLREWAKGESHSAEVYGRLDFDASRGARPWEDPDLSEALKLREENAWNQTWARRYTPAGQAYQRVEQFLEKSRRHKAWKRVKRLGLILILLAISAAGYFAYDAMERQRIEDVRAIEADMAAQADRGVAMAEVARLKAQQLGEEADRLRLPRSNACQLWPRRQNWSDVGYWKRRRDSVWRVKTGRKHTGLRNPISEA